MKLEIGNTIKWESAAGVLDGIVKDIFIAPAANGVQTPWMNVEYDTDLGTSVVMLCASASNLTMMKVRKNETTDPVCDIPW